jgi:cytochrome c biogenesis factor
MWFLNFIPDAWLHWFVHGVVALGIILSVVGAIAKNVPVIGQYGTIIKAIGGLLFIAGIFFEGGYGVEMSWRTRTNELQQKLDVAEKKSDDLKEQLDKSVSQKTTIIKEKVVKNAQDIEQKRNEVNTGCTMSNDAWMFYNRAVAPKISNSTR